MQSSSNSSFAIKVDIAISMAMGANLFKLRDRLDQLARAIASEYAPIDSPLLQLIYGYGDKLRENLKQDLERACYYYRMDVMPDDYFNFVADGAYVLISSKNVMGAHGSIRLHESQANEFFSRLRHGVIDSYQQWGEDPYPIGGSTVLLRLDSFNSYDGDDCTEVRFKKNEEGLLRVDPDTHPSDGQICFGSRDQELVQLSALAKAGDIAKKLYQSCMPSAEEILAAESRAKEIRARADVCFMPASGFCSWCNEDATIS